MFIHYNDFVNEKSNNLNENFYKWFNGSLVVDKSNNPLVVYHGTTNSFDCFEYDKIRTTRRVGFYFTAKKDLAINYNKDNGSKVLEVYLSIKNPLNSNETIKTDISKKDLSEMFKILNINADYNKIYDSEDSDVDLVSYLVRNSDVKSTLKALYDVTGKDGMILKNDTYVVFNPNQIKSIYNNGNWSFNTDNIYK